MIQLRDCLGVVSSSQGCVWGNGSFSRFHPIRFLTNSVGRAAVYKALCWEPWNLEDTEGATLSIQ